jgi:hypothetical protein
MFNEAKPGKMGGKMSLDGFLEMSAEDLFFVLVGFSGGTLERGGMGSGERDANVGVLGFFAGLFARAWGFRYLGGSMASL